MAISTYGIIKKIDRVIDDHENDQFDCFEYNWVNLVKFLRGHIYEQQCKIDSLALEIECWNDYEKKRNEEIKKSEELRQSKDLDLDFIKQMDSKYNEPILDNFPNEDYTENEDGGE